MQNKFERYITREQMPACPLCGKQVGFGITPVLFFAHSLWAVAHEECRIKVRDARDEAA